MDAAVENDPSSKERIQPYVGVEEVNNDPEQKTRRFVINFGLLSESESRQWPELMRIIEEKVKPERDIWRQRNTAPKESMALLSPPGGLWRSATKTEGVFVHTRDHWPSNVPVPVPMDWIYKHKQ